MFFRQKGNKAFKKRWVVFDGNDLRYYKPSDKVSLHNSNTVHLLYHKPYVTGIPRKGEQCLTVIYATITALNSKPFIKYLRTRPSKQIHTKKPLEKLFRCLQK